MYVPRIRPVIQDDLPRLLCMIHALAAHHGDTAMVDLHALKRDLFGLPAWLTVLVAEGRDGLTGYAALCPLAQLQFGVRGMDMHHLFVAPDCRGQGIGQALIEASLSEARRQDCRYITVCTHPDNAAAQAVYRATGFDPLPAPGPRFRIRL